MLQSSLQVKIQSCITIQRHFRGYISRKQTKKLFKQLYDRKKIIEELIITEEKYIFDLGIIVSDFQMALLNQKIINKDDAYCVFCNVDAIRKLNQHFFIVINSHFQQYQNYKIIFEDVKKQTYFFKIYFEYLNNFPLSMSKLKALKQQPNPSFTQFTSKLRLNPKYCNLTLQDYLIKPVQRLPKYVLLLKQLLKKTPLNHPDYANIQYVLGSFEEVNYSNNDKLNRLVGNFKLMEMERLVQMPVKVMQPGTEFVCEENVMLLGHGHKVVEGIMYLLNDQLIITKKTHKVQKFLTHVSFRFGTSITQTQDSQLYSHCFTVQSTSGDSITLLFLSQAQKHPILQKIHQQITLQQKKTYQKYSAIQSNGGKLTESFLKKISYYDLNTDVNVVGTEERTNNMLKYTAYIVEVRIRNVRQKVFLRYSELLNIQQEMLGKWPNMAIKQSLYKTTWLLNHKPRTIEERKICIQKFLKQVLAKPQIIENGAMILSKLGLPQDFYSLPSKFKDSQSFIRKSTLHSNPTQKPPYQPTACTSKTRRTYRLSIFQDLSQQQLSPRIHSYNPTLLHSTHKKKLTIQQLLQANELNLGHFIRYSENVQFIQQRVVQVVVWIPWIQGKDGVRRKGVEVMEGQRVSALLNKLTKQINLGYSKDFRLFLEKEYSQRVLDDDQIIYKVQNQLTNGKYRLIFKKMIYIDKESEHNELKTDMLRLKIIASQIIYEIKKAKYRIKYKTFLLLSVLIGIIQHQKKVQTQQAQYRKTLRHQQFRGTFGSKLTTSPPNLSSLALSTRQLLTNPYSSFFQNDKVWSSDFASTYKSVLSRLSQISAQNLSYTRQSYLPVEEEEIYTNLIQLCYISIVEEMSKNQLYGSVCYVVQVSQEWRRERRMGGWEDGVKDGLKESKDNGRESRHKKDVQANDEQQDTMDNRNVWIAIKCDRVLMYAIGLQSLLYQFSYNQLQKVTCYPSSIILSLRQPTPRPSSLLKLKTTNSFIIRQILSYYKNYSEMSKKLQSDYQYSESIMEMIYQNQRMTGDEERSEVREMKEGEFQEVVLGEE